MKVFGSIAVAAGVIAAFVIILGRGADVPADTTPASAAQTTVRSTAPTVAAETECVDPVACPPREGCVPKAKSCGTEAPVTKKECGDAPVAKSKGDCAEVVEDCEPSDCAPSDCAPAEPDDCKKPKAVADR